MWVWTDQECYNIAKHRQDWSRASKEEGEIGQKCQEWKCSRVVKLVVLVKSVVRSGLIIMLNNNCWGMQNLKCLTMWVKSVLRTWQDR